MIFLLTVLGLSAVSRAAGCGAIENLQPHSHPHGQLPPLAIGDSTMLLSGQGLAQDGYAVSAQPCRQIYDALALLGRLRAKGRLPHMVVIALGANGPITRDDIGVALALMCCTRKLVLVTPRQAGGAPGATAIIERDEARGHPGRILLLDWVKDSAGHPTWFQPDGLHLTVPGFLAFTRLLVTALPYAYPRHRHHRP